MKIKLTAVVLVLLFGACATNESYEAREERDGQVLNDLGVRSARPGLRFVQQPRETMYSGTDCQRKLDRQAAIAACASWRAQVEESNSQLAVDAGVVSWQSSRRFGSGAPVNPFCSSKIIALCFAEFAEPADAVTPQ